MALDMSKMFIYVEDNGDNTCTLTFNVPQVKICEQSLIEMSLAEIMLALLPHEDALKGFVPQMPTPINIPNSPED